MKLFVSLAAAPFSQWELLITTLDSHVDGWHLDYTNTPLTLPDSTLLQKLSLKPLWVHLMSTQYLQVFSQWAPVLTPKDFLTIQVELFATPEELHILREKTTASVGIACAPITPIKNISPYVEHISHITLMGVVPGKSGQIFLDSTLARLAELYALCWQKKTGLTLYIDGGITPKVCSTLPCKLITQCAIGSYITGSRDPVQAVHEYRDYRD